MPRLYDFETTNIVEHVQNVPGAGVAQQVIISDKGILVHQVDVHLMNNGQNPGSMTVSIRACNKAGNPAPKVYAQKTMRVDVPMDVYPDGRIVEFEFDEAWKPSKLGTFCVCVTEVGDGGTHNLYGSLSNPVDGVVSFSRPGENNRWIRRDERDLALVVRYVALPKKKAPVASTAAPVAA